MCGVGVMAQPCTHSGDFVGGNRGPNPAAADEHRAANLPAQNAFAHSFGVIRIIDWIGVVCAQIDDLMPALAQVSYQLLLQRKAGVIGTNGDFHALLAALALDSMS